MIWLLEIQGTRILSTAKHCNTLRFIKHVFNSYFNCYRQRRLYIDSLKSGHCLTCNVVLYSYASGNNLGSIHFGWKVPDDMSNGELAEHNQECLRRIQPSLPTYHTRAMRREFYSKVSLFKCTRPATMREVYKMLTGGCLLLLK